MTTFETVTVRSDAMALDEILWRRFKRAKRGIVERVYALNPGLSAYGPILPVGATFVVPIDAPTTSAPLKKVTRLWG